MDGGEYKNVWNVFEHWSEATMARSGSAMDGGEYKNIWNVFEQRSKATLARRVRFRERSPNKKMPGAFFNVGAQRRRPARVSAMDGSE
ncbi:MAG: hypothetical protein A2203_15110 [Chromatiales bacterium RIFOXYA1_FULL_46_5]|nr:MAG: hypothetical protein A2203_15110 [Chromatiales bacterium RIFOXYA1_FULL_46_5]